MPDGSTDETPTLPPSQAIVTEEQYTDAQLVGSSSASFTSSNTATRKRRGSAESTNSEELRRASPMRKSSSMSVSPVDGPVKDSAPEAGPDGAHPASAQLGLTARQTVDAATAQPEAISDSPPASPGWEFGAGVDTSSLLGNTSDDGSSDGMKGARKWDDSTWYGKAEYQPPFFPNLPNADPNAYGTQTIPAFDYNTADLAELPPVDIRYNEQTQNFNITQDHSAATEPPPYQPSIVHQGPGGEPAWADFMSNAAPQVEKPSSLPLYRTPAHILRDTELVFNIAGERAFEVGFRPATEAEGEVTISTSSKVTLEDMQKLLPHPKAVFLPSLAEWIVVARREDFLKEPSLSESGAALQLAGDVTSFGETPLFQYNAEQTVPVASQLVPVEGPTDAIETFKVFTSHEGPAHLLRQVFVSSPGAIPTIIPAKLLLDLRASRISSPPPGVSSDESFDGAVRLLLRIISNALAGNTQAIPTTNKALNTKLGWDDTARALFAALGWMVKDVTEPEPKTMLVPPQKLFSGDGRPLSPEWPRMGRAWVELSLWARHSREKLGIKGEQRFTTTPDDC